MAQYFSVDYRGAPFTWLGPAHLAALGAVFILNMIVVRFKNAGQRSRQVLRWTLALGLWSAELAWHAWNVAVGTWNIQYMLPLNVCSILIWLSGLLLVCKSYRIYEFAYFIGIGGAIQYLATPDLGIYGFPHFRFFQTFISHGLLLTAPVYMTIVEGLRPTWKSVARVTLWLNIYAVAIYFINSVIGSDYLMLNAKPATPSLLDILPPWPYYIVFMEVIGAITVLLLYLPFVITDRRAAQGV